MSTCRCTWCPAGGGACCVGRATGWQAAQLAFNWPAIPEKLLHNTCYTKYMGTKFSEQLTNKAMDSRWLPCNVVFCYKIFGRRWTLSTVIRCTASHFQVWSSQLIKSLKNVAASYRDQRIWQNCAKSALLRGTSSITGESFLKFWCWPVHTQLCSRVVILVGV